MTAALTWGEWSAARPGLTLPPGKTRYPFYRRLGGPQGRSGRAENLVPTGIRSRTVQPVVSHYNDWATQPTLTEHYAVKAKGGVKVWFQGFLTSALDGGEWSASQPCGFTPWRKSPTYWQDGIWVVSEPVRSLWSCLCRESNQDYCITQSVS